MSVIPKRAKAPRVRADLLLVQRHLVPSREQAQAAIMEGLVYAPWGRVDKPGTPLPTTTPLEVKGTLPYVGRGGLKLAHALERFGIQVEGLGALDVGSSTGGFTDCLLQHGARKVYAVDVGHGQLAYRLRQDPRVLVMEGINARYTFALPEPVDLATIDVSFISVTKVIPMAVQHLHPGSPLMVLIKPQFEAPRHEVPRTGVVKDPQVHARALGRTIIWAVNAGLRVRGLTPSPILGDAGNREFFLLLYSPAAPSPALDTPQGLG